MSLPREVEMVALALGRFINRRVVVVSRSEWHAVLRAGGKPTRLPSPFEAFRAVQGDPGFQFAVASGLAYTAEQDGEAGIHNVRWDENDPPEERVNTDSSIVIENLTAHPEWAEALRIAGLEDTDSLRALCDAYVYAYPRNREKDHHWPTIPKDIADAKPKEDPPNA